MRLLMAVSLVLIVAVVPDGPLSTSARAGAAEATAWPTAQAANRAIGRGVEIVSPCCDDGSGTIEGAADAARSAGFQSVRYSVHLSTRQDPNPPHLVDPGYLTQIRVEVGVLVDRGFTVVLNNNDNLNDPDHRGDRSPILWRQVAAYFADLPPKVYFEIQNEPTWTGPFSTMLTAAEWNPIVQAVIPEIRATNPERIIVVPGGFLSIPMSVPLLQLPAGDDHLIATFHNYLPLTLTHQGAPWVPGSEAWLGTTWSATPENMAWLQDTMNLAVCWSRITGVPLFLGEFGVISGADAASRVAWTRQVVQLAEAEHISWTYFMLQHSPDFDSKLEFGIYDERTGAWDQPILDVLMARPASPIAAWATCPSGPTATTSVPIPTTTSVPTSGANPASPVLAQPSFTG